MARPVDWPAVGAAIVDQKRAEWTPGFDENRIPEPAHSQFTRAHVQLLIDCGCTRQQVLDYASQIYNPLQLARFATDLESYTGWR